MATLSSIETLLRDQRGAPPIDKWHPELSGDIDLSLIHI